MPGSSQRGARERLLAAADELFYDEGITSTGIDSVVGKAHVALGSMYHHFGGKAELVEAYLRRRDHQWRSLWEAAIADAGTPMDRLLAVFDALAMWTDQRGLDHGCAHVAAMVQLDADQPGAEIARRHKRHMRNRLAELAREDGFDRPDELALALTIVHEGALATVLVGDRPDPLTFARALAATLIELHRPN